MIVENPYTQQHYLVRYFPIKAKIIDKDRTQNGDYYKKPTQYFFINCEPEMNIIFEPLEWVEKKVLKTQKKTTESTERFCGQ